MNAGNKANGALLVIVNRKSVFKQARLAIHNGVPIPTLMYGSESWVWQKKNESRINAVEMRSLRSICGVSRKDRCRNSDVRERCGLKENVVTRVEGGMLRWFGHLERVNESKLTKQNANVCDGKVSKGRPRKSYAGHIGGVFKKGQILSTPNRRACMKRLMDVSEGKEICKARTVWKSSLCLPVWEIGIKKKKRAIPEKECLAGAEVGLSVAALVLLVALQPARRAVRAEHLRKGRRSRCVFM
ncbi:hypothetical protein EVAR_80933_1 [Eumeta japonica]|uniref:Uncharacterized protein n=1 Tax=Eumeta variegata TaxID=151549 RepID=A0A4C1V0B7_EUMVA|nr:hypothetical protein EVAR_80933_1 [Eumeta japonica]